MRRNALAYLPIVLGLTAPAFATTKGLNQIVTPDVQPFGILSLSAQQQDPNIANRYEVQLELGLTRRFEVAVFQGYSPPEQIANAEYAILQNGPNNPYLLSVGFFNWTTKGSAPQPYIEGGYYKGNTQLMLGAARVVTQQPDVAGLVQSNHQTQAIFGLGYRVHPRVLLQLDYQSGIANSATGGYAVLTWNINVFAPRPAQPPIPATLPKSEGQQNTPPAQ